MSIVRTSPVAAAAAVIALLTGALVTIPVEEAGAATSIQFVLSPPTELTSGLAGQPGVLTETFDGLTLGALVSPGSLAVGTFTTTGTVEVFVDETWCRSGSQCLAVDGNSGPSSLTLTLTDPARYLGFWWAAGNDGDLVTLFGSEGGTGLEQQLGVFDSASVVALLSGATVKAIDDVDYATSLYKPNDTFGQPFAYVNLQIDDEDLYFTRIVFSKSGTGGLELDNLTTSAAWGQAVVGATGIVVEDDTDDTEDTEDTGDTEDTEDTEDTGDTGDTGEDAQLEVEQRGGGESSPDEATATTAPASPLLPTRVSAGEGPMRTSDPIRRLLPVLLALSIAGLAGARTNRRSTPSTT